MATELTTWATGIDQGGEYTEIHGNAGPCDAAGHSFGSDNRRSGRLSPCLVAGGRTTSFASGPRGNATFTGSVPYAGSELSRRRHLHRGLARLTPPTRGFPAARRRGNGKPLLPEVSSGPP